MAIRRCNLVFSTYTFLAVLGCNSWIPISSDPHVRTPKVMQVLEQAHHSADWAQFQASRSSDVCVSDVLDAASGQSVMGEDAPLALTGDIMGKRIVLRILGSGFSQPRSVPDLARRYEVAMPSDFIAATFVGQQPFSVLLADTIPLQPAESGTFSANELTMELDSRSIVDLQIAGLHTLTVTSGNQKTRSSPENLGAGGLKRRSLLLSTGGRPVRLGRQWAA